MQRSDFVSLDEDVWVCDSVCEDHVESWVPVSELVVGDCVELIDSTSWYEVIDTSNNLITLKCNDDVVSFPINKDKPMNIVHPDESTSLLQQFRDLLSSAQAEIEDYNINSQTANDLMLIIQSKFIDLLLKYGVKNNDAK